MQALFTLYGFTFPITVTLLQMAVIAPVCYIVAKPKLEWGIARGILPLALVNVLNVVCGLMGERLPSVAVSCADLPVSNIGFLIMNDTGNSAAKSLFLRCNVMLQAQLVSTSLCLSLYADLLCCAQLC